MYFGEYTINSNGRLESKCTSIHFDIEELNGRWVSNRDDTDSYIPHQYSNGECGDWTANSDRLSQENYKLSDELKQKHFGNKGDYWNGRSKKDIEAFLQDFIGNETLVLCRVIEYENASNGYPYWRFDYYLNNNRRNENK